jgi:hypothetical protein
MVAATAGCADPSVRLILASFGTVHAVVFDIHVYIYIYTSTQFSPPPTPSEFSRKLLQSKKTLGA